MKIEKPQEFGSFKSDFETPKTTSVKSLSDKYQNDWNKWVYKLAYTDEEGEQFIEVTNRDLLNLINSFGDETDNWIGRDITIGVTKTKGNPKKDISPGFKWNITEAKPEEEAVQ